MNEIILSSSTEHYHTFTPTNALFGSLKVLASPPVINWTTIYAWLADAESPETTTRSSCRLFR